MERDDASHWRETLNMGKPVLESFEMKEHQSSKNIPQTTSCLDIVSPQFTQADAKLRK